MVAQPATLVTVPAFDIKECNRVLHLPGNATTLSGELKIKGVEIEASHRLSGNFELLANHGYNKLQPEVNSSLNYMPQQTTSICPPRRRDGVDSLRYHSHVGSMNEDVHRLGLLDEEDIDLDEAALALALLDHPGTELNPYYELLDAIVARLEAIGHDAQTPAEQAEVLADVLAGEYGFSGDTVTYDHPDNADLIRVIDRRRGLPVSLSILWVAAARRLGWSADLLDVPGHVLVLIGSDADPVIVDPFCGGARVGPDRIKTLVEAFGEPGRAVMHIGAMPNRAALVRLLQNQASRAEKAGQGRRALELYTRMTTMAPATVHAWWERARLELVDGDVAAARGSLGAILEVTREPEVREQVSQALEALHG